MCIAEPLQGCTVEPWNPAWRVQDKHVVVIGAAMHSEPWWCCSCGSTCSSVCIVPCVCCDCRLYSNATIVKPSASTCSQLGTVLPLASPVVLYLYLQAVNEHGMCC
jgi:hypothetical protein